MYRSLLVPLDGSAFGEHALPFAVSLARRAGAALQVVRVHAPLSLGADESLLVRAEDLDRETREEERAYLEQVVARLQSEAGVGATAALLDGAVVDALEGHAAASGADLVIMTTHGRGPLARFWLGSVADAVVRRLTLPVLLVRPREEPPRLGDDVTLRRLLVPLDGSELAERILEPAVALGTPLGAEYLLLRAVRPPRPPGLAGGGAVAGPGVPVAGGAHDLQAREREKAQAYLEQVAERLRARSLPVWTHLVLHEQPALAILENAVAYGADLIALATHGRGGLSRLLLGSVADKVLRGSSLPVLVRRPEEK